MKPNINTEKIRKILIKEHDDGDDKSAWVDFNRLLGYIGELELQIEVLNRVLQEISRKKNDF